MRSSFPGPEVAREDDMVLEQTHLMVFLHSPNDLYCSHSEQVYPGTLPLYSQLLVPKYTQTNSDLRKVKLCPSTSTVRTLD